MVVSSSRPPRVDLSDERQGDCGEQTGLSLGLALVRRICIKTHEYQGVHIFVMPLDEFFFGRFAVALVKFCTKILRQLFFGCGV